MAPECVAANAKDSMFSCVLADGIHDTAEMDILDSSAGLLVFFVAVISGFWVYVSGSRYSTCILCLKGFFRSLMSRINDVKILASSCQKQIMYSVEAM